MLPFEEILTKTAIVIKRGKNKKIPIIESKISSVLLAKSYREKLMIN